MPDLSHLAFCDRLEPLILDFADLIDGTAEDLYLLLWSRRVIGDGALHASGDTALLEAFLEKLSEV